MGSELKPCPFCGETVGVCKEYDGYVMWWKIEHIVDDSTCKAYMVSEPIDLNSSKEEKQSGKAKLVQQWNHRTQPPEIAPEPFDGERV